MKKQGIYKILNTIRHHRRWLEHKSELRGNYHFGNNCYIHFKNYNYDEFKPKRIINYGKYQ